MFSNTEASESFEEFLNFIGEKIELSTWKQFRGGLDVKSGTTGTHTIYKRFNNNDIIFHVSTMLPFNPKDKQQLERKRHIGNDIVVIIFQDGETIYKPTTISSRQVHVVFVVKEFLLNNQKYYRLSVVSRDGVPDFGPEIPKNSIFPKNEDFLNFFYAKCKIFFYYILIKLFLVLNAEKACYKAPILSNKISRTRTSILRDLAINFT
jgi:RAP1 GTPase activating protein 1